MQGSLALFDAIAPILRSKGLLPHPSKLSWSSYGRSIDVSAALNADALALLHAALLELGFKESDRLDYPTFASVLLKKGRLRLRLHLDTKRSGLGMKAPA